jgi:hypothetical protein
MTANLPDYLVSTTMDVPDIELHHEQSWSPDREGGFKGVGEGGVIGTLPAIVNAITDALRDYDARITRLPVHPQSIMAILAGSAETAGVRVITSGRSTGFARAAERGRGEYGVYKIKGGSPVRLALRTFQALFPIKAGAAAKTI